MAATATQFKYTVRNSDGQVINGEATSADQATLSTKLADRGYTVVNISEVTESSLQKELSVPGFKPKVKLGDLAIFSRQFATMIGAGLSLIRALTVLEAQAENPALKKVLAAVASDLQQGVSLSEAMGKHDAFPQLYVAMVKAGEASGQLDGVLNRLADTMENDVRLRGKIKSAMAYPVVVLMMAVCCVIAMLLFVVPTFSTMFTDMGGELPALTQALVIGSNALQNFWYLILPMPFVLFKGFKASLKNEQVRSAADRVKLKIKVFGPLFHKIAISRFTRNFGTLLKSGVPLVTALEITAETVNNVHISNAAMAVRDGVREGEPIAPTLAKHEDVIPPMVVQMVGVGEETGTLDQLLEKIADFYDEEVERTTEALTSLLEPLMIGLLGGIVGVMVVALYLPMFGIFDLIQ